MIDLNAMGSLSESCLGNKVVVLVEEGDQWGDEEGEGEEKKQADEKGHDGDKFWGDDLDSGVVQSNLVFA